MVILLLKIAVEALGERVLDLVPVVAIPTSRLLRRQKKLVKLRAPGYSSFGGRKQYRGLTRVVSLFATIMLRWS
jgi:hypothetical protein